MRIALLVFLTALMAPAADQDDVIALVQKTFDGMLAKDATMLESLFLKDARLVAVREDGATNTTPVSEWAGRLAKAPGQLLERMWAPQVRVNGRIASLWAPYDFHRDGKFSHCGIDHVDLVKTSEGWKIAALVYTVQTKDCAPSPLGAVKQ